MHQNLAKISFSAMALILSFSTTSDAQLRPVLEICNTDAEGVTCKARKVGDLYRVYPNKEDGLVLILTPKVDLTSSNDFQQLQITSNLGNLKPNSPLERSSFDDAGKSELTLELSKQNGSFDKTIKLSSTAFYTGGIRVDSIPISFMVDSTPPSPLSPVVERFPGGSAKVYVKLKDIDLDVSKLNSAEFTFHHVVNDAVDLSELSLSGENVETSASTVTVMPSKDPEYDANRQTIVFEFTHLNPGVYGLKIEKLFDVVGNKYDTESTKLLRFQVPAGEQRGQHVEYPRFLPPGGEKKLFDPGDTVDTRVVNLYYFRDARRVAELINRNIQDLNQASYDDAQRFANNARNTANIAIDERRFLESKAVRESQKTRELARQMNEARQELNTALAQRAQLQSDKAQAEKIISGFAESDDDDVNVIIARKTNEKRQKEARRAALSEANNSAERAELKLEIAQLETEIGTLRAAAIAVQQRESILESVEETIGQAQQRLASLPQRIEDQQTLEFEAADQLQSAEAKELRTAQEKFRRELAAGLADRNSYAKGDLYSEDPVTQVTISVVGPARLQLRGPIKGINKIRRMVHQLDTPVGQVKVGVHTVQVNGENGDRMDFVYERINREVAHSRFLVNQSNQMFRKAVAEVATSIHLAVEDGYAPPNCPPEFINGNDQASRDWRYVYTFFGRDFIDELREMDSELLNTNNKMLTLHALDTISLSGALFVTALARDSIRHAILTRFHDMIQTELPQREIEYVKALTQVNIRHGKIVDLKPEKQFELDAEEEAKIWLNAQRTYHFPNTHTFFNQQLGDDNSLNSMQYAMIRMAQVLKAQLVAEMEFKNLTLERSLLETKEGEIAEDLKSKMELYQQAEQNAQKELADTANTVLDSFLNIASVVTMAQDIPGVGPISPESMQLEISELRARRLNSVEPSELIAISRKHINKPYNEFLVDFQGDFFVMTGLIDPQRISRYPGLRYIAAKLQKELSDSNSTSSQFAKRVKSQIVLALKRYERTQLQLNVVKEKMEESQELYLSKRLLEQFLDEQEEKSVELLEALRSHSSNVDNYLKRLAIALEDDVNAQFYEPAFQRVRRVSRTWDVNLGQIETTTVLTNNRTLAKVDPTATMEFDLPRRDIPLTEAMGVTKALVNEYGNLLQDETFLAGTSMIAGQVPIGIEGDNSAVRGIPGYQQPGNNQFGAELQKLIPDPAVYKFETGTGFEIRPVIQPDGHSIVYTFDYMYTTNVREPVRADEKHLGRIKRHFIHTDVQTSSYELREISRYTVALKASRTGRGVPFAEDLPIVGSLFRPLPSDESSLQTNIILGSSVIYPTMYDLMGLRWSPYVDDLHSQGLAEQKQVQFDRREQLREHLMNRARSRVNTRIKIPNYRSIRDIKIPTGF